MPSMNDLNITDQDIDDIMCTALEGGITYWCMKAEVIEDEYYGDYASDQISKGGSLRLYGEEDDEIFELTKEKFLNGLEQWAKEHRTTRIDPAMIDADHADCIVQYALFGELVYG